MPDPTPKVPVTSDKLFGEGQTSVKSDRDWEDERCEYMHKTILEFLKDEDHVKQSMRDQLMMLSSTQMMLMQEMAHAHTGNVTTLLMGRDIRWSMEEDLSDEEGVIKEEEKENRIHLSQLHDHITLMVPDQGIIFDENNNAWLCPDAIHTALPAPTVQPTVVTTTAPENTGGSDHNDGHDFRPCQGSSDPPSDDGGPSDDDNGDRPPPRDPFTPQHCSREGSSVHPTGLVEAKLRYTERKYQQIIEFVHKNLGKSGTPSQEKYWEWMCSLVYTFRAAQLGGPDRNEERVLILDSLLERKVKLWLHSRLDHNDKVYPTFVEVLIELYARFIHKSALQEAREAFQCGTHYMSGMQVLKISPHNKGDRNNGGKGGERGQTKMGPICFRCGLQGHIVSSPDCPENGKKPSYAQICAAHSIILDAMSETVGAEEHPLSNRSILGEDGNASDGEQIFDHADFEVYDADDDDDCGSSEGECMNRMDNQREEPPCQGVAEESDSDSEDEVVYGNPTAEAKEEM
ncbi:hypothetical protein ARMGADRAFT_1028371 [Armillaria gallica]|uniref:CCHC-type domain-containing protein n=1 Tax=Armillaria gallica TaxID=47427 RepID=A0A2H3DLR2_ARMGA|nr:hypothetical protein ARMGADRAFT_1028371 [Armillaria gallica]